jgi:hypothetical protein
MPLYGGSRHNLEAGGFYADIVSFPRTHPHGMRQQVDRLAVGVVCRMMNT